MDSSAWFEQAVRQPSSLGGGAVRGAPHVLGLTVSRGEWREAAADIAGGGGRLLALWASRGGNSDNVVRAAFVADAGVIVLALPLSASETSYPGIEQSVACAGRLQRAIAELSGLQADSGDARPWLRHAAWPPCFHPLVDSHPPPSPDPVADASHADDPYAFVQVAGEGVHEIPVGPVHAGIIEPGHFRFSVVGEKVLRLEERLGYVHKGIEHRFTELPMLDGHRLAARVSGDTAVAFSWAYCQALEGMSAAPRPHGHAGSGRWRSNWSGSPIIWAISARSATTLASPLDLPSSPDSRSSCCARPKEPSDSDI